MHVQIYAMKTPEEARLTLEAGADMLGVVVGLHERTPDEVNFEQAQRIFAAIPPTCTRVGLTIETRLDTIIQMAEATEPDILHLSGPIDKLPPDRVADLRRRLPGLPIMQALPVTGPEAVDLALAYERTSDYFLLDTNDETLNVIGATGATHDWSVSREIVAAVDVPVILAGGLSPENVAEAIRVVRPWGVDSNTHTNVPNTWRKDPERVRRFVQAAKQEGSTT